MNKLFKNKLALIMVVMMAFCSFSFVGCTTLKKYNETADETTTVATTQDEATTDEPATFVPAPTEKDFTLAKVYKPYTAFTDGKEVSLETIYGTGYVKYGDELTFNTDGTFTAYIGVTAGNDSSTGTYKLRLTNNSQPEIELCYNNDTTTVASVVTLDVDNNVVEFRLEQNGSYILFKDANN